VPLVKVSVLILGVVMAITTVNMRVSSMSIILTSIVVKQAPSATRATKTAALLIPVSKKIVPAVGSPPFGNREVASLPIYSSVLFFLS